VVLLRLGDLSTKLLLEQSPSGPLVLDFRQPAQRPR
jgi:hypothetical protein